VLRDGDLQIFELSAIRESSVLVSSAALKAELNKSRKHADIIAGVDFIPFAIETSGVWGVQALELVSEIQRLVDV